MASESWFLKVANALSRFAGKASTFVGAVAFVVLWAVLGPVFGFSDTWQLVINTSTTIITFLMVFLIQNTQNRDNNALHAKLDELIRVSKAHNSFIGIENLADKELEEILAKLDEQSAQLREASGRQPTRTSTRRRKSQARRKSA